MRAFTIAERRNRLARRHFLTPETATEPITRIAATLIGLHATDPATPYLSLWARSSPFTVADLDSALYEKRSLIKQLAMRRTLWVIDSTGLPAVQAGASDRVADAERRRLIADVAKAGVAEDGARWLARAGAAVLRHLGEHGPAGSAELRAALPELAGTYDPAPGKAYGGQTHLAPRALTVLGAQGDIVRGPNDAGWTSSRPRWATAADWLGEPGEPISAEEAQERLVATWLRAFGPATADDIKWWFGTTKTAVRKALSGIGAVDVDLHGTPGYALPDDLESEPEPEPWVRCFPASTSPRWAGITATGISASTAASSSTTTATPDPRRGGTAGSWAAGARTTPPRCSCSCSRIRAGRRVRCWSSGPSSSPPGWTGCSGAAVPVAAGQGARR